MTAADLAPCRTAVTGRRSSSSSRVNLPMSEAHGSLAPMRNLFARSILVAAVLIFPSLAMPQTPPPFNAHDLSGVWQLAPGGGGQGPGDNFPKLTPWGQAKYDANKPGYGPTAAPGGNDPILKCDPMGFPHVFCSSDAHDRALPSRRSQHDPVQPDHR